MKVLIKNCNILDPANRVSGRFDIMVQDGKISKISRQIQPDRSVKTDIIDAKGLLTLPGFVDLHAHLREPGFEYKETIDTGTRSAVAGGWTSVCCMPNTEPVNDNSSVTRFILERSRQAGRANVFPVGAISKGLKGQEIAEIGDMVDAGIVAISDDGNPVMNSLLMRRAMEYSKAFNIPVISHCEDVNLGDGGVMNEGRISARLGLKGIPAEVEESMILRDIALAGLTGARLHIAHVSTKGGVYAIRAAKKKGLPVTAEATPHHLLLTEESLCGYDTNFKVKPPLRTREDIEALEEGLADGTIDAIATDHAPHAFIDKEIEFDRAAFGIIGFETAFSLLFSLVKRKVLTMSELIAKFTINPAKVLGINKGTLSPGSDADITLIDIEREYIIDSSRFYSKSKNTPFDGWKGQGRIEIVFVGGRMVFRRDEKE